MLRNHALRIAIEGALAVFKRVHRGQEIRYLHSGVQQVNKISGGNALALGYVHVADQELCIAVCAVLLYHLREYSVFAVFSRG